MSELASTLEDFQSALDTMGASEVTEYLMEEIDELFETGSVTVYLAKRSVAPRKFILSLNVTEVFGE